MTWPNRDQTPLDRGETGITDARRMDALLEEKYQSEIDMIIPKMDVVAGGRPLSNILAPGEENMNVVRITGYGALANFGPFLVDSVIPANRVVISVPGAANPTNACYYISLGPNIGNPPATAFLANQLPDQTDIVLAQLYNGANPYMPLLKPLILDLPRKRHLMSVCMSNNFNAGSSPYAISFIFLNLDRR